MDLFGGVRIGAGLGGWIFGFIAAPAEGMGPERPSWRRPPGGSAVCRLQTALGLRPRRALSSAEAKLGAGGFRLVASISRFRFL